MLSFRYVKFSPVQYNNLKINFYLCDMFTELTREQYSKLDIKPMHCYNSIEFIELNAYKVAKKRYFAWFDDDKLLATIILGESADNLRSPFSAPFGGFDNTLFPTDALVEIIFTDLSELSKREGKPIVITLPPEFYSPTVSPFVIRAINSPEIKIAADYNYHFVTSNMINYNQLIPQRCRRKIKSAVSKGLRFQKVSSLEDEKVAYNVIRRNREAQNYPLRMTWEQVNDTKDVVKMDFFIMFTDDNMPIASALCYYVTPGIIQVIYWGDLIEYRSLQPMNLFAMKLFNHYYSEGIAIVDVGPSSSDGIPSRGLCTFKQYIGCQLTPKITLTIG